MPEKRALKAHCGCPFAVEGRAAKKTGEPIACKE